MSQDSDARCASHPEVLATAICRRCGSFLCASCARPFEQDVLCEACLGRQFRAPEVSWRAWLAFSLGIAGVVFGLVPGLLGWWVAEWEARRIDRGESPPGGRTFVDAARKAGWLCAAGLGVTCVALLYWFSTH
ncbi:hypothetical protein [Pyxidicoccus xibeiensis]|uniref:hypothetical protein n=1 Tax=Pyxidicoccus xibeiensis TaxID=2906759 RepID=UPI0020A8219F|nr:hypothetical protein [Pyxidicoccus xibeiensis]MCP3136227.1 hypothetical protein [Pyxidicoccus xibeiensis]